MIILGINYFFHDSSACIVKDGKLLVTIEEERLIRQKHTNVFPDKAIRKCVEVAGIETHDIEHIAVSIQPTLHWPKKLLHSLKYIKGTVPFIKHEILGTYYKQKRFWQWYSKTWVKGSRPKVHFVEHHKAHIIGSFFVSPYNEAALLSLDGSGEWSTAFLGYANGLDYERYCESYFPQSLGSFYEAVTEFCGFQPNYDEGKTMGLAPFGDPERFYSKVDNIVSINDKGEVNLDQSYFSFQTWGYRRCSQKFYDTFGRPRSGNKEIMQHHMDAAAAFQKVLEEKALKLCQILREKTNAQYLVIAGGVALNSVMNGRILRESGFKDLYVMPAAGDNGTAIGAAYYLYNGILRRPRCYHHDDPYLGTEYGNEQIRSTLDECKLDYKYHEDICHKTAALLRGGNIIGWFQGRMEVGPRSLGNRSILADPTIPNMKDKINAEVKHREAYRPFAPSATSEGQNEFFDITVEAPFMLKVCDVRHEKQSVIHAVTHVDGSARLQTVRKETNPRYHSLITKFGELSGVPVILNTSFNIMGEPMVESPIDAIRCFFSTGLDILILGNYLIRKKAL